MNTEQKCCEKCIRWLSRPHPQAMGLFDCAFNFNCPCHHTEQKGWREPQNTFASIYAELYTEEPTPKKLQEVEGKLASFIERTLQKGWREGYWDIFLQEFEMSDFARFAIKKEIERTLQEQREEMVNNIGMLRQWLNERPANSPLLTNEDLKHWLIKDTK